MKPWLPLFVGLTLLNQGCSTIVPPCPCQQIAEDLDVSAELLAQALRDKGVLRQQLKACQER
jgi:hypothetical protein